MNTLKNTSSNSFQNELENPHRLHYVSKAFEHGVNYQDIYREHFEPSKFIYAYFSFNSFYNYNWYESVIKRKLTTSTEDYEWIKYSQMIDFILAKLTEIEKKEFIESISKCLNKYITINTLNIKFFLDEIIIDDRIDEGRKKYFITSFNKLITNSEINKEYFSKNIIQFIYKVKNNIFHGSKNTIQMTEKKQRQRLDLYATILIETNELLFKVLSRENEIDFHKTYDLNLGLTKRY